MKQMLGWRARGALVVGGVVAVALLAGCGEGNDEQQVQVEASPEFLAASAARTAESSTGRFEMRMQQEVEVGGTTTFTEVTGEGSYDADADRLSMEMHTRAEGEQVPGGEAEGEGDSVQDGYVLYFRGFPFTVSPEGEQAPGVEPDEWVTFELPDEATQVRESLDPGSGAIPSPQEELERLLDGVGEVEEVGTEDVRGLTTTHLSATYQLPEEAVEALQELVPDDVDVSDQPVDVWIDGDGIVRRLESGIEVSGGGVSMRMSNTQEYFDLGAEVDIEVPEDAIPLEDLVGVIEDAQASAGAEEALSPAQESVAAAAEEAEADYAEQIEQRGTMSNDPADFLANVSPEMAALAQEMRDQLTHQQRLNDPCQVAEDPVLRATCERHVMELG